MRTNLPHQAKLLLLCCCMAIGSCLCAQHQPTTQEPHDTQQLLNRLDDCLADADKYDQAYEAHITALKAKLTYTGNLDSPQSIYQIQEELCEYYDHYQSDSAMHYARQNIQLAKDMNWQDGQSKSQLHLVHVLNTMGLLISSHELLEGIDRSELSAEELSRYYSAYMDYYIYCQEYALDTPYADQYLKMAHLYGDSVMQYMNADAPMAFNTELMKLVAQDPQHAYDMIVEREAAFDFGTRPYSILMSFKSYACNLLGRREERKQCLALSSMSDIHGSIKENTSMRDLANLIYDEGDYERANRYLKSGIADSQFFNSRHRNSQNSQILPKIDAAYSHLRETHQLYLYCGVAALTILSVILVIVLVSLHRQKKRVESERLHAETAHEKALEATQQALEATQQALQTNQKLQEMNSRLADSNRIKEEYVGRYMSQCTDYIQQLDSYRKRMFKLSQTRKMSDLQDVLRSEQVIEDTLKDFYQNFDRSFLELFPNFVEQVNQYMADGEQFHLKGENQLNSELRILALLRLGIQDNTQMANFLRCTKSTIYTYRSKLKNRSVNPNEFEKSIMHCA